jgi:hypothetical protein
MSRSAPLAGSGLAVGLVLAGAVPDVRAQRPDSTLLRPTDVVLTVTNDPHLSGVFRSSGTSTKCGLAPFEMPHRNPWRPSCVTPWTLSAPPNGPYSRTISAAVVFGSVRVMSFLLCGAQGWPRGKQSSRPAAKQGVTRSS